MIIRIKSGAGMKMLARIQGWRQILAMVCALILGTLSAVHAGGQQDKRGANVFNQLRSEDERERMAARDRILSDRKTRIAGLIALLKGETKGDDWLFSSTSANLAIDAIGELRAKEAVPELLRWLLPPSGPYHVRLVRVSPAGRALIKIGKPSVSGVIETLVNAREAFGRIICVEVLVAIEGKEASMRILNKAIGASTDLRVKQNYVEAKRLLGERYPSRGEDESNHDKEK